MKIIIPQETLLKSIRIAESFLFSKTLNKADILIDASSDITKIFATDLDTSVIINLNATIEENGSLVVFGKKLSEIISNLPSDDIELTTTNDNMLKIKTLNAKTKALFSLKGLPKDEYPKIPDQKNDNIFKINQKDLKELIHKVISSASNDDTSYVLNGVLFNIKRDKIKLVATDGRRLSLISKEIDGLSEEKNVIVSKKVLNELEKMLSDEGECQIGITENQIFFYFDNISIISRLIEGEYPDYQQVIPSDLKLEITFNKDNLLKAVKRISILVSDNYKKVTLNCTNSNVTINATDPDIGDATEEIPIEHINKNLDDNFVIAFNSFFLLDVLKVLDEEFVVFKFNQNTTPALIKEKENQDYLSIIMPMKLI